MRMNTGYYHNKKHSPDWVLLLTYLFLVVFGWLNIYSSAIEPDSPVIFDISQKYGMQFIWLCTSLVLGILILYIINPNTYEAIAPVLYVFILLLLIAVIFVGRDVNGSRSWFEIGPVKFQPAELSKISTSLLLAYTMSKFNFHLDNMKDAATIACIILIPMATIVLEKETGSALVYAGFIFMLFRQGLSGWFLSFGFLIIFLFVLTMVSSPLVAIVCAFGIHLLIFALASRNLSIAFLVNVLICILLAVIRPLSEWIMNMGSTATDAIASVDIDMNARALEAESNILEKQDLVFGVLKPEVLAILLIVPAFVWLYLNCIRKRLHFIKYLAVSLVSSIIIIFSVNFIFENVLQAHQRARIENLLGITEDLHGIGYNVFQSKIAIGSGGWIGKGFLNGTQTKFNFVPEQSTDFIFCTVGEEWGFLGSLFLVAVYMTLIIRLIILAERQNSKFAMIYGYCVACCLFMHVFINMGMTMGLLPVIGIPLPFLSYGGSSMWSFTILLAIFVKLDMENKRKMYY